MNSNTNKLKNRRRHRGVARPARVEGRGMPPGGLRGGKGCLVRTPEARVEGISGLVGWLALRGEATLLEGSRGGNWWPCWAAHVEGRGAVSRELSRREGAQRQQLRQWGELQRAEWRKRAVAL
ncbi:hypothetical protein PVAP13_1KG534900 [Panicum virgatum]|uniref:Uncharacterized protein n=1 Tax=Panicum virgatum TaxID=38727 RepID=A0A8T0XZG4_PANVG|nr:hypothetical protein PVAP13_1KG534900 [Panicum virgatum]